MSNKNKINVIIVIIENFRIKEKHQNETQSESESLNYISINPSIMTSFNHSVTVLLGDKILRLVSRTMAKRKHLVELTKVVTTNKTKNNKQKQKQKTKA